MDCLTFFSSALLILLLAPSEFERLVFRRECKAIGFDRCLAELDRGLVNNKPLALDEIVESCLDLSDYHSIKDTAMYIFSITEPFMAFHSGITIATQ